MTHILRAADIAKKSQSFSHPWNPKSEAIGVRLAPELGLKRIGVSIVRLPPGKESFVYHLHHAEEEWLYVLDGHGVIDIDGTEHDIGAGDFVAFPPGVAHHLRNGSNADFSYLMGGEQIPIDIADFPRHGKRLVRNGGRVVTYSLDAGEAMGQMPKL